MHNRISGPWRPENIPIYPDVDLYFQQVVEPGLAARAQPEAREIFLNDELEKWERAEALLAEWAARDDDSPNPFTPALDPEYVSSIIAELNGYFDSVQPRKVPQLDAAKQVRVEHRFLGGRPALFPALAAARFAIRGDRNVNKRTA